MRPDLPTSHARRLDRFAAWWYASVMSEAELHARLALLQRRLEAAQVEAGVQSIIVYALVGPPDGSEPPSIVGGESVHAPGRGDARSAEFTLAECVTLLGYLASRIEVMKQENSAQFGPQFTIAFQREVRGNLDVNSPTGLTAFQSALSDLVQSFRPAVAFGATVGGSAGPMQLPPEPGMYLDPAKSGPADVIVAVVAAKREYERMVRQIALSLKADPDELRKRIDEASLE